MDFPWLRSQNLDQFLLLLLVLLVFLLPLLFTTSTYAFFEPAKLTLLRLITTICLGLYLTKLSLSSRLTAKRRPFAFPLFFLIVGGLFSTLTSIDLHTSLWGDIYRYDGYVSLLAYVFLFYLTVDLLRSDKHTELLISTLMFSSAAVSVYGISQSLGHDFIHWNPELVDVTRVFSTFGNPVFLAAFLTLIVPVSLGFFFKTHLGYPRSLLFASIPVLSLICLFLTRSRAAWLAITASLVIMLVFNPKIIVERKRHCLLLVVLLLIFVLSITLLSGQTGEVFRQVGNRLASVIKISEALGSRPLIWKTAVRMIEAKPLLGYGFDTFRLGYPKYQTADWIRALKENAIPDKAHNDLLQVSVGQGLMGLLFYLWFLATFLWKNLQLFIRETEPSRKIMASGLFAGIIGYLIQIQFSFSIISVAPLFWLVLGLTYNNLAKNEPAQLPRFNLTNPLASAKLSTRTTFVFVLNLFFLILALSSFKLVIADQFAKNGFDDKETGAWEPSAANFRLASSYNPGEARYFTWLGEVSVYQFLADGNPASRQNAIVALEKALQLDPLEKETYYQLGNLYLRHAQISRQPSHLKLAVVNFKRITELDPYDVDAYFDLSAAYSGLGQLDQAITTIKKATKYDPSFWQAFYALAQLYQQKGDSKKAGFYLKKAVQIRDKEIKTDAET